MNRILFILALLYFQCQSQDSEIGANTRSLDKKNISSLVKLCHEFDSLNDLVLRQKISKNIARENFSRLIEKINKSYFQEIDATNKSSTHYFPLRGYDRHAIGGTNGNGYLPKGYDYFDGNLHKGHPAHDIFITDKDQNCIDDRSSKKVEVLSISNGIVVATEDSWNTGDTLRGGKFIYILDINESKIYYYAHNDSILVKPGDPIKAGNPIAYVGRTGLNAYKKRSPTHLHLMTLSIDKNGIPIPFDSYKDIVASKTTPL